MGIRNVAVVRAQELEVVGNVHGALAAYREAADRGNPGARVTLGVLLAQRGDAQGAEAEFRVADKAGDPIAAHNLGFLHEERGELAEAQSAYRRSAQRGHASGAMALARLLHEAGDLRGAEEACRRAAELGDVQGARNYTSLLFQRTGETKPGLAAIREAAKRKYSTAPDQPWWRTMPLNAMTDDQKTEAHRQDEEWRRQLQTRMAVIPINPLIGEEILGEAEAQLELNQRWQAELAVAADAAKVETEKDREKLLKLRASPGPPATAGRRPGLVPVRWWIPRPAWSGRAPPTRPGSSDSGSGPRRLY